MPVLDFTSSNLDIINGVITTVLTSLGNTKLLDKFGGSVKGSIGIQLQFTSSMTQEEIDLVCEIMAKYFGMYAYGSDPNAAIAQIIQQVDSVVNIDLSKNTISDEEQKKILEFTVKYLSSSGFSSPLAKDVNNEDSK